MNGATVDIFPGPASPLNFLGLLVGFAQTRKSQMTKFLKVMGGRLDERIKDNAVAACAIGREPAAGEAAGASDAEDPQRLILTSACLSSFTPAVLFERFSGDYRFVANAEDFASPALRGALHQGRIANMDEAYPFAQDFGLLHEETRRRGGGASVNPYAGALNRML
eukprot:660291-Karenia_brevis.AAC.1